MVKKPSILIAGCGTGRHAVETLSRFDNSTVLAVDLSLTSLAYAQRKTNELGLNNIHYMQADILSLKQLNRTFDIIECSGVLHHMSDPLKGWKELVKCLKSGGLMKIGLYSELARKSIVKIQQEIKEKKIGSSEIQIRDFRSELVRLNRNNQKTLEGRGSFFSMSEFRDLLFHVQEHRFTLEKIQIVLEDLGLIFCGFENEKIVREFKIHNEEFIDLYDLTKWIRFEKTNPRIFMGMYQFWCQKI